MCRLNNEIFNAQKLRNKQMEHAWVVCPILLFVVQFNEVTIYRGQLYNLYSTYYYKSFIKK